MKVAREEFMNKSNKQKSREVGTESRLRYEMGSG